MSTHGRTLSSQSQWNQEKNLRYLDSKYMAINSDLQFISALKSIDIWNINVADR